MTRRTRFAIAFAAGLAQFAVSHAEARPRHHHHHHRARIHDGRPAAWCGWYLARYFGLSDRRLWLARYWAQAFPRTEPHVGAVVVYPHHVGVIVGGEPGRWIIHSGNDGHRVRTRGRSVRGAIAFVSPGMRMGSM